MITAQNGITPNATQNFTLNVNPGALTNLTLSPSSPMITAGGSQPYTATGFDHFGNSLGDVTAATTFTVKTASARVTRAAAPWRARKQ